jgi:hypothetical protein
MKVKSIVGSDPDELEQLINMLIDGKKIIDIKYLISPEVKVGDMTLSMHSSTTMRRKLLYKRATTN